MAKSLKILVILALVSSALPKALEPNFVDQIEDVTSNVNEYNVTPEMKKSLQEIIDALKPNTLSSELIGVICVVAILGLIGATFLVCLFVKIASCCKSN